MKNITKDSKDSLRVTDRIRKFLWQFPQSSPKQVCRMLNLDYKTYRNMVSVEKSHLKKYLSTKIQGRLLKPLVSAHRVEWELEKPLDMVTLVRLDAVAAKCRPRLSDPRPVDQWYVIPNRNGMREFHNEFVTVRTFPKSGTVRILAGQEMDFVTLQRHVKIAFLQGGLDPEIAEAKARLLVPGEKHRTFRVGPVTPFKIDFYKDPLGLTLKADISHPEHIETVEGWPSWIRPLLVAVGAQTQANEKQTEAITLLTEQIKLHLEVMKGINDAVKDLKVSTDHLRKTVEPRKPKPFDLKDWLRDVRTRKLL